MGRPKKDFTGQVVHHWTVLYCEGSKYTQGKNQPVWRCRCICGNERSLSAGDLGKGTPRSCGCVVYKKQPKDISGQRFGYLTAIKIDHIEHTHAYWLCQCDCGNLFVTGGSALRQGITTNCGCKTRELLSISHVIDEVGNNYGRLTVVRAEEIRGGEQYWFCECECGNVSVVRGSHLRDGSVKSCMCYSYEVHAELRTTHGLSKTKEYHAAMCKIRKEQSRKLEIHWTPAMEIAIRHLFPYCVVCGMTEEEHLLQWKERLHIDHVRPLSKGYPLRPGNAVVLCRHCNTIKHSKLLEELPLEMSLPIEHAASIFERSWRV